ncbi:MAG: 30S ribosomal protein S7 [Methanocellales archaeon]|nr:30S ribosomal protein S7 [Methanocellales archaeon]MDD3291641.1 30S ribosomal protein S7 [Methanocellales archaeon]MDD5235210.1 30S ribosomal protein S7 [Methanocellales archaeon]MDD5485424.1 30S ribosomal protein S7 [Methanocellales archaeon]
MSKIFGKWDFSDVKIDDLGVKQYINLNSILLPHTGGKALQQFSKSRRSIIERLINKVMRSEHNTGKKTKAYNIVKDAFDIIYAKTKENPMQSLIKAIENAGPREETVRLKYGGISVPKAVDTSSQRRVDQALMFIVQGAQRASFKNKRSIEECLASEIIAASKYDVKSFSISRKGEKERVAKAAR